MQNTAMIERFAQGVHFLDVLNGKGVQFRDATLNRLLRSAFPDCASKNGGPANRLI
jgi:hypothetical protein